jgi:hypothetical protein
MSTEEWFEFQKAQSEFEKVGIELVLIGDGYRKSIEDGVVMDEGRVDNEG